MAATLGSGERWTEGTRSWPEGGTGQGLGEIRDGTPAGTRKGWDPGPEIKDRGLWEDAGPEWGSWWGSRLSRTGDRDMESRSVGSSWGPGPVPTVTCDDLLPPAPSPAQGLQLSGPARARVGGVTRSPAACLPGPYPHLQTGLLDPRPGFRLVCASSTGTDRPTHSILQSGKEDWTKAYYVFCIMDLTDMVPWAHRTLSLLGEFDR